MKPSTGKGDQKETDTAQEIRGQASTSLPVRRARRYLSRRPENCETKAHALHPGEESFLLNCKHDELYLSGRGECGSAASEPLRPPTRSKTKHTRTHTQKPSIIDNHLQLSLAVPVAVGLGVPGAPAFLHCLKELVHKAQGGVVEERFEVVCERGGGGLVQNLLLRMSRRRDRFHGLLRSCERLFGGGCNPAHAAGAAPCAPEASETSLRRALSSGLREGRPPPDKN